MSVADDSNKRAALIIARMGLVAAAETWARPPQGNTPDIDDAVREAALEKLECAAIAFAADYAEVEELDAKERQKAERAKAKAKGPRKKREPKQLDLTSDEAPEEPDEAHTNGLSGHAGV